MYWVVTTVVSETKAEMRAKIIKQYIKIASEYSTNGYMLDDLVHVCVHTCHNMPVVSFFFRVV